MSKNKKTLDVFVAILPYRRMSGKIEYLFMEEIIENWSDIPMKCSISKKETLGKPVQTVRNLLVDVSGYTIPATHKIVSLGTTFGDKTTNILYKLYTTNLTGFKKNEQQSTFWSSEVDSKDPIVSVLYQRVKPIIKIFVNQKL